MLGGARILAAGVVAVAVAACTKSEPSSNGDAPASASRDASAVVLGEGGAAPLDAGAAAALTFTKKPPAAGDVAREENQSAMELTLHLVPARGPAQDQAQAQITNEARAEKVLEAGAGIVTKLEVSYAAKSLGISDRPGVPPHKTPSPLTGRKVIVAAKGDGVDVLDPSGAPLPVALANDVRSEFRAVGKPDPFLAAIPTRPLVPGDRVEELAQALSGEMTKTGGKVSSATVTFRGLERGEGVFDLALTMTQNVGPALLSIDLHGELRARAADARMTLLKLEGPITAAPDRGALAKGIVRAVTGEGRMSFSAARSYP